jgi:hypothetical protein
MIGMGSSYTACHRHVDTIDLAFLAAFQNESFGHNTLPSDNSRKQGLQDMANNKGNTHRLNRRRKLCTAAIKRV